MGDLISRSAMIEAMEKNSFEVEVFGTKRKMIDAMMLCCDIADMPTVDAKPVVHGYDRWQEHKEHCEFWCSECGYWLAEVHEGKECDNVFNFCPKCGAKMDGKKV